MPEAHRERCYFEGVTHMVSDEEHWRSRCWTWCDLRLDWGDRAGGLTEDACWPTDKPVTCLLCLARTE